jgi:hypothetical protein
LEDCIGFKNALATAIIFGGDRHEKLFIIKTDKNAIL